MSWKIWNRIHRSGKKQSSRRTRSAVAKRAASGRQARRRRQTQTRRNFEQRWQQMGSTVAASWRWLPDVFDLEWRGNVALAAPGFSGWHRSKLLSLMLLVLITATIVHLQDDSYFVYREDVRFLGSSILNAEELYACCDVESWSILWIDPDQVREQVKANPYVADAQVSVRWPAQVDVVVDDVQPVALWHTGQGAYWLLEDGSALPQREGVPQPGLRIVDPEMAARAPSAEGKLALSPQFIEIAHQLTQRLDGLNDVRYNREVGINFSVPNTATWVYWGDERHFEEKWLALETVLLEIQVNREEPRLFNVTAPNRPFFRYFD